MPEETLLSALTHELRCGFGSSEGALREVVQKTGEIAGNSWYLYFIYKITNRLLLAIYVGKSLSSSYYCKKLSMKILI